MLETIAKLLQRYGHLFLAGLVKTLEYSALSVCFGVILGALICIMRMSKIKPLSFLCSAFIEVIRGTPILLQLYFFYFALPKIMPFELTDTQSIVAALVINCSAYISELIRAGIQAVDPGQSEAARSLGLSTSQTMKKVVLPQAIKNILPALGNEFIMEIKQTSLAATFFLGELMTVSRSITAATFLSIEPLIIAGTIYFCLTFTLSKVVGLYEKKVRAGD
ncbi:Arginine transport system permease protein ArtQ [bioreactor metagenome]|uniref:Arginine transport system permease protein ArtQ n=1 Tax=bioreactor metagenome TaxID=1076179 RepID=A0A645B6I1_9ZZZZ